MALVILASSCRGALVLPPARWWANKVRQEFINWPDSPTLGA